MKLLALGRRDAGEGGGRWEPKSKLSEDQHLCIRAVLRVAASASFVGNEGIDLREESRLRAHDGVGTHNAHAHDCLGFVLGFEVDPDSLAVGLLPEPPAAFTPVDILHRRILHT